MVGADESTDLWRHPHNRIYCYLFVSPSGQRQRLLRSAVFHSKDAIEILWEMERPDGGVDNNNKGSNGLTVIWCKANTIICKVRPS